MPIYAYMCTSCGHEMDKIQKISDEPLKTCPECSEISLKKKITSAAFQLKGTGWYVTDFRDSKKKADSKNTKDDKKSESSPTTSESSATNSASESKKDTAKEAKKETGSEVKKTPNKTST